MFTVTDHYISLAQFAFILSSIFFAAVRWFHMCHPYDRESKYYYPDRPETTLIFLAAAILLPYAICPSSTDAWMLVKGYFIIIIPFDCTILLYKYFGTVKQWHSWRRQIIALGIPFGISLLLLLLIALVPQWQLNEQQRHIVTTVIYIEGIVSAAACIIAMIKVYNWVRQLNNDDYSNPDDFPVTYAKKVLPIPIIHLGLLWPIILTDSQVGMAFVNITLAVCYIILLIIELHPQRSRPIDLDIDLDISPASSVSSNAPSQQTIDNIIKSIRDHIEKDQLYLNPHFSMQDVVNHSHYGRTYVSWVFKNKLGGFFNYINTLRLEYARKYQQKHPMATLDEVAAASGFTTRQSLYRVKKRLSEQK